VDVPVAQIRDRGQQRAVEQIVDVTTHRSWEGIVETVQIISQKRISEHIIEDCPCASVSDFERDRRVAPASRLDGRSRCETVPLSGVSTEATVRVTCRRRIVEQIVNEPAPRIIINLTTDGV